MARAADIWRITCPSCNSGRVLASDGGGSIPPVGPFAIHDCFFCGLPATEIALRISQYGLPSARERSDHGEPLARAHYHEELARCERALGPHHFAVARCHVALARNYSASFGGDSESRTLTHYRTASSLYPGTPFPDHPTWFELFAGLGYHLKGSAASPAALAEARACYDHLRWLYERALGPAHLLVADCWRLFADLSLQLDDSATAAPSYERELTIWRAAPDDAIAAYRDHHHHHHHRHLHAHVASTTFALHPLHREPEPHTDMRIDYREHQLLIAGARLATALGRLGADVHHIHDIHTHVFGELSLTRALHIGDFLFQTDKAFRAAISFYEIAERLGAHDPLIHSIRAKLQLARSLAEHQPHPAPR